MQQIRAYKDGSKRWVIVIEDSDASLDEFVMDLVKNLSCAKAEPVAHLDDPAPMATPQVDYSVLEEIKEERPAPPSFVKKVKEEDKTEEVISEPEPEAPALEVIPEKEPEEAAPGASDAEQTEETPEEIIPKEDPKLAEEREPEKLPATESDSGVKDYLRGKKDEKRLKDIIMRRYHTSDIEQVLATRPIKELEILKKQIG